MRSSSADSFQDSLWYTTAEEPDITAASLQANIAADVLIIGAGFTGCSAALALAGAGASVVVVEAQEIGWGASGRNGGQVIPGAKLDPSELKEYYGQQRGAALAMELGAGPDLVFDLIERHQIRCSPSRKGWIQAAHAPMALKRTLKRAEEWRSLGAPVELLTAEDLRDRTGVTRYCGGWRDGRAGTIQPLSYVRGLARAAIEKGAAFYSHTPAESLRHGGDGWVIKTPDGEVRAKAVILGTDAYTDDLVPGLKRSLLLVQSIQVATEPLPDNLLASILPGGECLSETRRLAFYFRRSPDNRLMFGGRGSVGLTQSATLFDGLLAAMRRTVPDIGNLRITHRWSGQVGLTLDGCPHVHELQPGLFAGLGYNGRGIALATLMGKWLAERIHAGIDTPLPSSPLAPIPWHAARKPIIAAGIATAWVRDRMGFAS